MVNGIGSGSGALGREAIRAALDTQSKAAEKVRSLADHVAARPTEVARTSFQHELDEGLRAVNEGINQAENLPNDFVAGKIEGFHEIAVQLKQADIGFRFALEIRNKLIDAYREVMRMNV